MRFLTLISGIGHLFNILNRPGTLCNEFNFSKTIASIKSYTKFRPNLKGA